tara:strand:+ start:244 stop:381 length:138 start_codon:yes stop_codon:yes gene_type:complete
MEGPQENPSELKAYVKESEAISQAFALVAEHGPKQLNRYKAMMEV